MIHAISIENFFSIAERQEPNLRVLASAPDLPCFRTPLSDASSRLPVAVGFFGPNASGKSTLLHAIVSSFLFAYRSFNFASNVEMNEFFQPYKQGTWRDKPTKITIEFDSSLEEGAPLMVFRYELHISHSLANPADKAVAYEALSYAPEGRSRYLFERIGQTFHFGKEFGIASSNDPRREAIRRDASVISTLVQLNHQLTKCFVRPIGFLQPNIIGCFKVEKSIEQWLSVYAQDQECLEQLNRELRRIDVGLESMSIEQGNQGLFAKFKHSGLDEFIPLKEESAGTRRFIEIFLRLHYALKLGSIAIIDELDHELHPLLLPELLRWFSDPSRNPLGAQLFFTAHNPALLDQLEKEQIFFTQKPSGQATYLYGARDIKGLRREPSLMKKYLSGELGAVPHVG